MDADIDPDDDSEDAVAHQAPMDLLIRKSLEHGAWLVSRVLFVAVLFLGTIVFETPLKELARGNVLSKYEEAERARLFAEYEFLHQLQVELSATEVSFSDARQRCGDSSKSAVSRAEAVTHYEAAVQRLEDKFAHRTARLEESLDEEMYPYLDLLRRSLATLKEASRVGATEENRSALQAQRELHDLYTKSLDVRIESALIQAKGKTVDKR